MDGGGSWLVTSGPQALPVVGYWSDIITVQAAAPFSGPCDMPTWLEPPSYLAWHLCLDAIPFLRCIPFFAFCVSSRSTWCGQLALCVLGVGCICVIMCDSHCALGLHPGLHSHHISHIVGLRAVGSLCCLCCFVCQVFDCPVFSFFMIHTALFPHPSMPLATVLRRVFSKRFPIILSL